MMKRKSVSVISAGLFLLVGLLISMHSVYALDGWQYYRDITIDNTQNSNTLTNYQVMITLDTASLISEGKMRSDCGDIRITEADGTTTLSYWIEDGTCNTTNTHIWVKVPSIPASSTYTIQIWYGNSGATRESSISNTFIWGDDFEDGTSKFSYEDSSYYSVVQDNGQYGLEETSNGGWTFAYTTGVSVDKDYVIEYSSKRLSDSGSYGLASNPVVKYIDSSNKAFFQLRDDSDAVYYTEDVGGSFSDKTSSSFTMDLTNPFIVKVVVDDNYNAKMYVNGQEALSYTLSSTFQTSANVGWGGYSNGDTILYWFFVRQYTATEPTTTVGTEQTAETNQPPSISILSPEAKTYYGVISIPISFKAIDMDNSTIDVKAYLDNNLIYNNSAYTNNTLISFSQTINEGKDYNLTIVASDGINNATYKSVLFHVWYGANITANVNTFDITIGINGINTTYNSVNYKEIEWSDVGNGNYADIWITKSGYDSDYKRIYFNNSMGIYNVETHIYTVHTFYMYDSKNNKYIQSWNLHLSSSTYSKDYSTSDYTIKISTRNLEDGVYALNATAFGYNYVALNMNLNNSQVINYSFETQPTSFLINVYDEESNQPVLGTNISILYDNKVAFLSNYRQYINASTSYIVIQNPSNAVDYDLNSYARVDAEQSGKYMLFVIAKNELNERLCMKIEKESSTSAQSGDFYLQVYNRTSQSYTTIASEYIGNMADGQIYTICGSFSDPNNDFGHYMNVKLALPDSDTAYLRVYEIYQDASPEKTYALMPSKLGSSQISISINALNYPTRTYYVSLNPYSSISLNAYLLPQTSGSLIGVTVKDKKGEPLGGVLISVMKYISGAWRVIEQKQTDDSGTTSLFLKAGDQYKFKLEKNGYVTLYKELIPTTNTYTFFMSQDIALDFNQVLSGISISLLPIDNSIQNLKTNISYIISSYYNDLEYFGMLIYTPNGSILYNKEVSTSPSGGEIDYNLNLNNINYSIGQTIKISTWFKKSNYSVFYLNKTYTIWYYETGNSTLINALNEMKGEDISPYLMVIITVTIMIITVAGVAIYQPYLAIVALLVEDIIFTATGMLPALVGGFMGVLGLTVLFVAVKSM